MINQEELKYTTKLFSQILQNISAVSFVIQRKIEALFYFPITNLLPRPKKKFQLSRDATKSLKLLFLFFLNL